MGISGPKSLCWGWVISSMAIFYLSSYTALQNSDSGSNILCLRLTGEVCLNCGFPESPPQRF